MMSSRSNSLSPSAKAAVEATEDAVGRSKRIGLLLSDLLVQNNIIQRRNSASALVSDSYYSARNTFHTNNRRLSTKPEFDTQTHENSFSMRSFSYPTKNRSASMIESPNRHDNSSGSSNSLNHNNTNIERTRSNSIKNKISNFHVGFTDTNQRSQSIIERTTSDDDLTRIGTYESSNISRTNSDNATNLMLPGMKNEVERNENENHINNENKLSGMKSENQSHIPNLSSSLSLAASATLYDKNIDYFQGLDELAAVAKGSVYEDAMTRYIHSKNSVHRLEEKQEMDNRNISNISIDNANNSTFPELHEHPNDKSGNGHDDSLSRDLDMNSSKQKVHRKVIDLNMITSSVYNSKTNQESSSRPRTFKDIMARISDISNPLDKRRWRGPVRDGGLWHGSSHMATFDHMMKSLKTKPDGPPLLINATQTLRTSSPSPSSLKGSPSLPKGSFSRYSSPQKWGRNSQQSSPSIKITESDFEEWLRQSDRWQAEKERKIKEQQEELKRKDERFIPRINPRSEEMSNNSIKKDVLKSALELLSLESKEDVNLKSRRKLQPTSFAEIISPSVKPTTVVEDMIQSIFLDETKTRNNINNNNQDNDDTKSITSTRSMGWRSDRSSGGFGRKSSSPSVHDVYDRLNLSSMIAAKKYRSWTPPTDKELTLRPKLNETSLLLAKRRKMSKSMIEFVSNIDLSPNNHPSISLKETNISSHLASTISHSRRQSLSPTSFHNQSMNGSHTRISRKPPVDQGTAEFRRFIDTMSRQRSNSASKSGSGYDSDNSIQSRKSTNSSLNYKNYVEEGYKITRTRSLSAQRKREQERIGKEIAINRQIEIQQTNAKLLKEQGQGVELFPSRYNSPIKQKITSKESLEMQERMKKSVETFLIRQTIARNLVPPGPGSYAYAHLDFLSLQPERKNSSPPPATTILSPESNNPKGRSPGSSGHRFSRLSRFQDHISPSKSLDSLSNMLNNANTLSGRFISTISSNGTTNHGMSSASKMAAIYKAARNLLASTMPTSLPNPMGNTVAERIKNRSPNRFRSFYDHDENNNSNNGSGNKSKNKNKDKNNELVTNVSDNSANPETSSIDAMNYEARRRIRLNDL